MAIAAQLADRFVGHHVDVLRLAESERQTIFKMLGALQADILLKMDRQIPLPGFESFKQQRLQALFTLTDKLIGQQYGRIAREHQSTLMDLAEFESEKTRGIINREVKVPLLSVGVPLATLKAMVNDDIVEGRPAKEWWAQQDHNLRGRFQQTMRQGVFAGETLDQLKQRVRGTKARNYQDGIMAISGRDAEALIRTSVQSVANSARYETLKANDDVVLGFEALVTLDTRTSELCMGRSGYAWDHDGRPLNPETKIPFPGPPPWHFNALAAGTRIRTMEGDKPIELVQVGDLVLTHRGRWRRVYATMAKRHEFRIIRRLYTDTGRILTTTDEHPMLSLSKGWQCAGNLQVGDQLFEDAEQHPDSRFRVAPLWLADQYPAFLNEAAVSYEFATLAIGDDVIATVDLQKNHRLREGKIRDVPFKVHLKHEGRKTNCVENVEDSAFVGCGVSPKSVRRAANHSFFERGIVNRIGYLHPHTMPGVHGMGLLGQAIGPVRFSSGATGIGFRTGLIDRDSIGARAYGDAVSLTPRIQRGRAETQRFLDRSNRFFSVDMPYLDQGLDARSIPQINHGVPPCVTCYTLATIVSIADVPFNGMVYNLAVEEDETYLAEGLVVHNCRTTLVPVLKSWEQLQREAKQDPELGQKLDTIEKKLGPGTQASMDGQVAGDLTYQEWLKSQPEERQIAILGRNRWQLWRRDVLKLSDLVDQTGRALTLDALKAKHGITDIEDLKTTTSREIKDDETIVPEANPEDNPFKPQRELASKALVAIKRNPNSGANGSKIVTFADETRGVFKPEAMEEESLRPGITRYYQREALASDVATIVRYNDLVPTTAVTTLKREPGSIQAFVPNATKAVDLTRDEAFGQSARDIRRAVLFDVVLGNTDRHAGNWMVDVNGKLALIDHGLTLSTKPIYLRLGLLNGLSAAQRAKPIAENMKTTWRNGWPKIEAAMEARGIERQAIRLAKDRLDWILTPGRTWQDIQETF